MSLEIERLVSSTGAFVRLQCVYEGQMYGIDFKTSQSHLEGDARKSLMDKISGLTKGADAA